MKFTSKERSIAAHAIFCRLYWIDEFFGSSIDFDDPEIKSMCSKYSDEKVVLEGILNKIFSD